MNILKKYIVNIVLVIIVFVFGIYANVSGVKDCIKNKSAVKAKKESVQTLNRDIEVLRKNSVENQNSEPELKKIYQPQTGETDSSIAFSSMFDTIMNFAKNADIKVRTIEFANAPESDKIVQNQSASCNSTLLNTEIIGTYTELQAFLRELYRYQYLVNIQKMEIVPYEKDKKILIAKLGLVLYARK